MNKFFVISLISVFSLFIFSCNSDSNDTTEQGGPSYLSVKLVDDPGDFDNVYIEVVDVMVKVNDDSEDDSGWESLDPINTGVYDLLDLTGGVNVLLVDDFQIPSGMLNQIRLVLGDDNSVVIDGETHLLSTPSAQQSGLKIKVNQVIEPGFTYDFVLDFDVDRSIVVAGNSGNIILKPVINATAEFSSGKIEGAVNPFDFQVMASVTTEDGEISAYADETGAFVLNGVPAGTYTITFTPDPESGYIPTTLEGVEVVNGQITNVGVVELDLALGSITGITVTADSSPLSGVTASVVVNGEAVSTTTNESGEFTLADIPVGIYTVTLTPDGASGLATLEVMNVEVLLDTVTDIGEQTLE